MLWGSTLRMPAASWKIVGSSPQASERNSSRASAFSAKARSTISSQRFCWSGVRPMSWFQFPCDLSLNQLPSILGNVYCEPEQFGGLLHGEASIPIDLDE